MHTTHHCHASFFLPESIPHLHHRNLCRQLKHSQLREDNMMELAATIVVKCLDGQAAAPSKQLGSLVDLGMQANERQQGEAGTGKRGLTRDDNCRHLNLSRARFFFFSFTPPSIFPDPTSTRSPTQPFPSPGRVPFPPTQISHAWQS